MFRLLARTAVQPLAVQRDRLFRRCAASPSQYNQRQSQQIYRCAGVGNWKAGDYFEGDAVVPKVTVRIEAERNIFAVTDVLLKISQLLLSEGIGERGWRHGERHVGEEGILGVAGD